MSLDPQARHVLDLIAAAGFREVWELTPPQARAQSAERAARLDAPPAPIARVEDVELPGPAGAVPARLYRPRPDAPAPTLVWLHGGGHVIGSVETYDSICRRLARWSGAAVLSVDYRLAPEHPFPAAVDDTLAAVRWAARDGADAGIDGARIAVGGDSAGGNLAAAVALLARDAGAPAIAFQLLIYPELAPGTDTASHDAFAEGHLLTRRAIEWFKGHYVPDARDRADFRYAPLLASSFAALPPALVVVAGHDPLRDEGVEYAGRLRAAGVDAELIEYEGMIHAFIGMAKAIDAATVCLRLAADRLARALGTRPVDD